MTMTTGTNEFSWTLSGTGDGPEDLPFREPIPGPQGVPGPKGDKGDRGERGKAGLSIKGDKGDKGDTGGDAINIHVDQYAVSGFVWGMDDTAPWQAALNAANTLGTPARVVASPGKLYKVQPLKFYSNTTIDLRGATIEPLVRVGGTNIWDAVFYTAGATAANGATGDGATVVNDAAILNGTISTKGRAYSTIKAQRANRISIREVTFPDNQDKIAVRLDTDTADCTVEACRIVSTLDAPFGTVANAQGVSIYSATVDGTAGAYGLYGTATVNTAAFTQPTNLSQRHRIINNHIENGTHGVAIQGGAENHVGGNTIINPSHRGVIVSPVGHRNHIFDNTVLGTFSCAYLLAFGSRWNTVTNNVAYCTSSQSEFNAFRASYGASDNKFEGNHAYGVTGAAYRAFTGAINNTFTANTAVNCGTGIEFRSLNTDDGYQQATATPAMTGNIAIANDIRGCTNGIVLRSGTTTATGTTPATTAGTSVPLTGTQLIANTVAGATGNGVLIIEDTAGGVATTQAHANTMSGNTGTDWQTPRSTGHFTSFLANSGSGMQGVHRLPATGNALEWRDAADALKAYISSAGAIVTTGRGSRGSNTVSTVAIDYVNTTGNTQIGSRVDGQAGQTADLQQWTKGAGPTATVTALSRIGANGHFITAAHAAPADADLANGDMAVWFDQTNGAAKLMIKAKQADGTVRTGNIALA